MKGDILITGSKGIIGSALRRALDRLGKRYTNFDILALKTDGQGDVLSPSSVESAATGCRGIVHLAAVSRVVWGQRDPDLCLATNIRGTNHIISAALASPFRPWIIYASSREVYGNAVRLPVREDVPLNPVNIYGRSKVAAEQLIKEARSAGLSVAIVRLSNVYGSSRDYTDRVVPAFVSAALRGKELRVDGSENTFDFTYIDDTVRGILCLIELLDHEGAPPPIHLLTGRPTTLGELARLIISLASSDSSIIESPPRNFDVSHFYGDPSRAYAILGWQPYISLDDGLAKLIAEHRSKRTL